MWNELTNTAVKAAKYSGRILREGFGTHFKISSKEGKNNLVTEYDHLSEQAIISIIHDKFPNHIFLAEESGKTGDKKFGVVRWIIDPLDGTVNFAHSMPVFSISIAAELDGELQCGVIYNPMNDELFVTEKKKGAWFNDRQMFVSDTSNLDSAYLVTGFPYNVDKNPGHCVEHFVSIIKRGIPIRRLGSAALDLAYVAAGRFDGFWELELNPWDVAAGVLMVREAGGKVTQYNNKEYDINKLTMLATNGKIHNELSETLLSCYKEVTNDC